MSDDLVKRLSEYADQLQDAQYKQMREHITTQAAEIARLHAERDALQARVAELEKALREMIYETTHLSPQEDDGSHWCKISKSALEKARAALEGKKDG